VAPVVPGKSWRADRLWGAPPVYRPQQEAQLQKANGAGASAFQTNAHNCTAIPKMNQNTPQFQQTAILHPIQSRRLSANMPHPQPVQMRPVQHNASIGDRAGTDVRAGLSNQSFDRHLPVSVARITVPARKTVAPPFSFLPNRQAIVQLSSSSSSGQALRRLGAGVSATGTLTWPDDTTFQATGSSGSKLPFSYFWPKDIFKQWLNNRAEVEKMQETGKLPYPDNDAEARVIDSLIGAIQSKQKKTNGGTLSLQAKGTDICKYCRKLIRTFCKHYDVTWINDPKLETSGV
jgi:hypothetical protein